MTAIFGATYLDWTAITVGLLGGLSLFLFGMGMMTDALKSLAGDGMRKMLARLTGNRFAAAVTGALVTAIIQSSSVTTVLLVGFITAGLMTLTQSVGVIMGANIGTTITAQIIAFKVTEYALWLIIPGFMLQFLGRRTGVKLSGSVIMGLGLLFFGMGMMSQATQPLRSYEPFIELMKRMDSPLFGIAIAAGFTALVQSSSATTGIVIVLAAQGFISLEAGIALVIGSNIGTCVTALLAAIGKPRPALQAAVVHVLFNVAGALLWVGLIGQLADVVRVVTPARTELVGAARLAAETPRQIANAHTLFNVANTFIFIGFAGFIARIVQSVLPNRPPPELTRARPKFLDLAYLETPALAVDRIRLELGHLGERVSGLVRDAAPDQRLPLAGLKDGLREVELLDAAILAYARELLAREISPRRAAEVGSLTRIANHLQSAAEMIGINLTTIAKKWRARRLEASAGTHELIAALHRRVCDALSLTVQAVPGPDRELAVRVIRMKAEINELAAAVERRLLERLTSDHPERVPLYRLESDAVELLKRVYYFAKRAAKILAVDEPEPEDEVENGDGDGNDTTGEE